ncbi:uncharacterized protein LOC120697602 [Panicum virgatum]|uniref:Uncharacterized protein n=1 Tax=Panicum virgatum TaxID=38727 RepID=A0A8T0UWA5_PANVG|nr:uncharacterized protein LOC120697602 [Panicum virgatum]XP_039836813.1 uncharacterized protein LOC120697602 [Panicum virgatum]KAG2625023.1 hypothetical protein PVAP13_3KG161400 [Panicum virgatum]
MDKATIIAAAPPAAAGVADPRAPPPEQESADQAAARLQRACAACLRAAALLLAGYSFAIATWRSRREPRDLAFVAGSGALRACLRRAEGLTPASPAGERRRLQASVWALSTALSCAFAYRVAAVMPPVLAALVWCMTVSVVLTGFFMLVLCKGQQQYQAVDNVDRDAAREGKQFDKISTADELV